MAAAEQQPLGENVLLRLDKAIYKGGDSLNVDMRTSAGLPTVYLDVVRGGQTMLSRWLDVKDGKAELQARSAAEPVRHAGGPRLPDAGLRRDHPR